MNLDVLVSYLRTISVPILGEFMQQRASLLGLKRCEFMPLRALLGIKRYEFMPLRASHLGIKRCEFMPLRASHLG